MESIFGTGVQPPNPIKKMAAEAPRSNPARAFCLTINRTPLPTREEFEDKCRNEGATAWVAQVEISPSTGRKHIQAFVRLQKRKRYTAVSAIFWNCHAENAKDMKAAWDYCTKEESRDPEGWQTQFGTPENRSDLHTACELIKSKGISAVVDQVPTTFVRYHRGLEALRFHLACRRLGEWRPVEVIVRWGPTDVGKTRGVFDWCRSRGLSYYDCPLSEDAWFDGYNDQPVLLLDEFYGQLKPDRLLKLLDGYVRQWRVKGGFVVGVWTTVFITCNVEPDRWYHAIPPEVQAAILRRITRIEYCGPPGN